MKKFLLTTAVALAMSTTAYAQTANVEYIQEAGAESLMASNLIGARIYATESNEQITYTAGMEAEWDDIGEINDVIVSRDGMIEGVILGVGGFLGMGEKDVAVNMDALQFVSDGEAPDEWFIVVNTTQEALEAAPAFVRVMDEDMTAEAEVEGDGMTTMETETAATMEQMESDLEETAETAETEMTTTMETVETETAEAAETMEAEGEAAVAEGEAMAADATEEVAEAGAAVEATAEGTETEMAVTADADASTTMVEGDTEMAAVAEVEGFAPVDMGSVSQEQLVGVEVYSNQNENVGEIGEVMADGAIVEVGGFLGLGEKQVLLPLDDLSLMADADGQMRVYVNASEEMLEQMPEYEAN